LPLSFVAVTVTADPVLNTNPEGAFRMIVPVALMSPVAPSSSTGPVNPVYVPPAVSAEMLALASVLTAAVAKADPAVAITNASIAQDQMSTFFWRRGFMWKVAIVHGVLHVHLSIRVCVPYHLRNAQLHAVRRTKIDTELRPSADSLRDD
jgi:hypothetical protein